MVNIKYKLDELARREFDKKLAYQWLTRFDQQENTKFHQDNAGNQSFLMLGYEPTVIESDLYMGDYVNFHTIIKLILLISLRNTIRYLSIKMKNYSLISPKFRNLRKIIFRSF